MFTFLILSLTAFLQRGCCALTEASLSPGYADKCVLLQASSALSLFRTTGLVILKLPD